MVKTLNFFTEESWDYSEDVRVVNTAPTVRLIQLLLPKMLEKKRGIFVNLSSIVTASPSIIPHTVCRKQRSADYPTYSYILHNTRSPPLTHNSVVRMLNMDRKVSW